MSNGGWYIVLFAYHHMERGKAAGKFMRRSFFLGEGLFCFFVMRDDKIGIGDDCFCVFLGWGGMGCGWGEK